MNKLLLICFAALLLSACGSSSKISSVDPAEMGDVGQFAEANKLMNESSYDRAIKVWEEYIKDNPDNGNANYKLAICYLNTSDRKNEAKPLLEKAIASGVTKNYDPINPTETKAPVEAYYYLGRAQHLNYELDKAIGNYKAFIGKVPEKHRLSLMSERQIEMCETAKRLTKNPENYIISNLGPTINGEYNDYSPIISLDENAIFFTSRRLRADSTNIYITDVDTGEHKEDIYVSYKDREGNWGEPELLNINTNNHAASVSITPDGQTLYIYYDDDGNGQLLQSSLVGETWSEPQLLGSDINTKYWETHVTATADGNTLYFTSNRKDGYGGRDIYRVVKLPNGEYSKALNVGPAINTEWEEESPHISPDGKTLYFASQGHSSMGGFDIFYSVMGDDGQWAEPKNIGYPLNTVDDDVFFVPTADGQHAYYASNIGKNQEANGERTNFGKKDIYIIDIPENRMASPMTVLKGYIYTEEGMALPDDMKVIVTNLVTGEISEYRPRLRDGAYVAILPPCEEYRVEYVANAQVVQTEEMKVPCESSYREIEREVFIKPVYLQGQPTADSSTLEDPNSDGVITAEESIASGWDAVNGIARFNRYFIYDYNQFGEKEPEYRDFIKNIEKIIEMNGSVVISIEASASTVPSSKFRSNEALAESRAKSAMGKIKRSLKVRNVDMTKVTFSDLVSGENGPAYQKDARTNKAAYEPFQYVKAVAK